MADTPVVAVLVIDDDPAVLASTALRLRRVGFIVVEAASGAAGIKILESRSDVSVILCDCTMPGLRGPDVAKIVLQRWPHIRFIATSGQPPAPDLPNEVEFLPKPFRTEALVNTIRRVLS